MCYFLHLTFPKINPGGIYARIAARIKGQLAKATPPTRVPSRIGPRPASVK